MMRDIVTTIACFIGILQVVGCGSADDAANRDDAQAPPVADLRCEPDEAICINKNVKELDVSGIRVIHKQLPGEEHVAVRAMVAGGLARSSRTEALATEVAFTLFNRGSPAQLSVSEYNATLASMAANIWGGVGLEYATFGMEVPLEYFDEVGQLYARMVNSPDLGFYQLDLVRSQFVARLETATDEAAAAATDAAQRLAFGDHPYTNSAAYTVDDVNNLTELGIRMAFDRIRQKRLLTVVVVGGAEESQVRELVRNTFGAFTAGSDALTALPPLQPSATIAEVVARPDSPTWHIRGYFPAPNPFEPDYVPAELAMRMLSSELFDRVRVEQALVYAIGVGVGFATVNSGVLSLSSDQPVEALALTRATIEEMFVAIDPIKLDSHRESFITSFYATNLSSREMASTLAVWSVIGGNRLRADEQLAELAAVTPEQVQDVLRRWLPEMRLAAAGSGTALTPDILGVAVPQPPP